MGLTVPKSIDGMTTKGNRYSEKKKNRWNMFIRGCTDSTLTIVNVLWMHRYEHSTVVTTHHASSTNFHVITIH